MYNTILRWLTSKSRKPVSFAAQDRAGVLGPFGEYAWAKYNLDKPSIDDGDSYRLNWAETAKLRFLLADSVTAEREFFYCELLGISSAPMVFDGLIRAKPETIRWCIGQGSEYCEARFSVFPSKIPMKTDALRACSPKSLYLYEYLSGLKSKKLFTLENTPKSVKRFLGNKKLADCYNELSTFRLLTLQESSAWAHASDDEAVASRNEMNYCAVYSKFLSGIESFTRYMAEQLENVEKYGWKLYASARGRGTECPICETLPNDGRVISNVSELLFPFHFNCGACSPLALSDESAASRENAQIG